MNRSHHAYSVHSAAELETLRAPDREAMLLNHAIRAHRTPALRDLTRLQNIATCDELGEVAFTLNSREEASRVADLRSVLARLRLVENELLAATDALAEQLGMVAM